MENASKALIMAASVLIALMIIGALLLMFNSLSNYQSSGDQQEQEQQVTDFNVQYSSYDRDNLRGTDMISLMNKVLDYNDRNRADGYTEMKITIDMNNEHIYMAYTTGHNLLIKQNNYDEDDVDKIVGKPNSNTGTIRQLESTYGQKYISGFVGHISELGDMVYKRNDYGSDKSKMSDKDIVIIFNEKKWYNKTLSEDSNGYNEIKTIYEDAKI